MDQRQLAELHNFATSAAFTKVERLVIRYADALTQRQVSVTDELFRELQTHFDDRQMVELTSAIAWENYRARFNRGLGIEADGFMKGTSCVIPQIIR